MTRCGFVRIKVTTAISGFVVCQLIQFVQCAAIEDYSYESKNVTF